MDWHRLFGLLLTDFFTDSPFSVELEKDLSVQQQFLDVVILRKGKGRFTERLPDGLDNLVAHNLVTFKSHHEALDDWVLKELTGHYVSYRKLVSPARGPLLPESEFRLYAVCSRFPHNLDAVVALTPITPGVYDCRRGTDVIRIVVVAELPKTEHNAPLQLFSASPERVAYGASHYRKRSERTSTLLDRLFDEYQQEGLLMPYTMEDFTRDYIREKVQKMTPEERAELFGSLPVEEIEQLLKRRREAEAAAAEKKKGGRTGRKGPKRS